jgi:hypothetical protein
MTEHLYVVVLHDPLRRGFDHAGKTLAVLEDREYVPLWLSNIYPAGIRDITSPDFEIGLKSHGRDLGSDTFAADSPEDRGETVATSVLLAQAAEALRLLDERFKGEEGLFGRAPFIAAACDAFDDFRQAVEQEPQCDCSTEHPGILWPWNVGGAPTGWSCVERCDDCGKYPTDHDAAVALVTKYGKGTTAAEFKFFSPDGTPLPADEGTMVCIDVPEPANPNVILPSHWREVDHP